MTDKEIIQSIVSLPFGYTEERIYEKCKFLGMTLEQFKNHIDRAIAARIKEDPDFLEKCKKIRENGPIFDVENN